MRTLDQQHPEAIAALKTAGYHSIAHMATLFTSAKQIDRELELQNNAGYWVTGKGKPTWAAERLAGRWISDQERGANGHDKPQARLALDAAPAQAQEPVEQPVAEAAPRAIGKPKALLLACPPENVAKLLRAAEMLECEVMDF